MRKPPEDLTGRRFERWTVLRFNGFRNGNSKTNRQWLCRCDCGTERPVDAGRLKNGRSKSCGCRPPGALIHGLARTSIYQAWRGMKKRCFLPGHEAYHNYGGRGITMCDAIFASVETLVDFIGHRPEKGMTIDRIDNDGHYSCGQCGECRKNKWKLNLRWATKAEQNRNSRINLIIEINGKSLPACDWADQLGLPRAAFYQRIYSGKKGQGLIGPLRRIRHK